MKNILLISLLISTIVSNAQCGMKAMNLKDRVTVSDLVIEGQVIAQESFESDNGSMILTRNTIEVTKIFKSTQNNLPATIDLITKGGTIGLRYDRVSSSLKLSKHSKGVFTLKTWRNDTYQAVAGQQSFIAYSQPDYKAYSILKQWENIETSLFNEIITATGNSFQQVADIDFKYIPSLNKIGTVIINQLGVVVTPGQPEVTTLLNVDAGVGDQLVIFGSGFGASQGASEVIFQNANTGGGLDFAVVPNPNQVLLWQDDVIVVEVPTDAGNGQIAVFIDNANNDISTQSIVVGYNDINAVFGTSTGNVAIPISLNGNNGSGGYDFNYTPGLIAIPDASLTMDDLFEKWRCTTGINHVRGADLINGNPANTSIETTSGSDGINVVKFAPGTDFPNANILAFVLNRTAGCQDPVTGVISAFVEEIEIVINQSQNFHFRDGGTTSNTLDPNETDFETVMLHELGHANQLGHVIDPTKVMHFSIASGVTTRVIDIATAIGGSNITARGVATPTCGLPTMQTADCGFIYTNSNGWSPFDPAGTVNDNSTITVQSGTGPLGTLITGDITVDSGATMTTQLTDLTLINGDINNEGIAIIANGIFIGESQSINGTGVTVFNEVDITNDVLNFNAETSVLSRFNNDGATINTNDNLTLVSTATQTAHVDVFEGTINGEVTIERHFSSRRAFRFISPSVNTSTSIFENWQEGGNFLPGLGTHITGSTIGANGFDATGSGNPSLFSYDNIGSNGWTPVLSTNNLSDNLTAGNPYRLLVRGDRDPVRLTSSNSNETTLRTKGTLATGNIPGTILSSIANTFNFAGNPYQAPINMENVLTRAGSNVSPNYFVWDPNLNTRGAYVTINTIDDISSNSGSSANKFAQPNQAFFVQTIANGPASINFTEADKDLSQGNLTVNSIASMRISALLKNESSTSVIDGFNMLFDSNYSNSIRLNDAQKLTNLDESISISQNGSLYSITTRELPVDREIIELNHINYRNTSYNYSILVNNSPLNTYLVDKYLNLRHKLLNNTTTDISFTIDPNSPGSIAANRFVIEFSSTTLSNIDIPNDMFLVYPNPSNGDFTIQLTESDKATIEIFNLLGQSVYNIQLEDGHSRSIKTLLTSGNYILKVSQNGQIASQKIIAR